MTCDVCCRCGRTVAVDGSLFNKHPKLPQWMQLALQELGVSGVSLKSQPDGSGVGAAVTAAAYAL